MELELFMRCSLYAAVAWVSFHLILTTIKRSKFNPKRQPPGPFPLPLFGNIFSLIGSAPQKALADLAKSYGPIMSLHLGCKTTVVVTSVSMAMEILQVNDALFSYRCPPEAFTALDHHECSVAMLPPTARWKLYRKILNSQVFSKSSLDNSQALRKRNVQDLLSYVQTSCKTGELVDIGQVAFMTPLKFMSNTCFSKDLGYPDSDFVCEFRMLVRNLLEEASAPNLVDAFPVLKRLDPQGIKKRTATLTQKIMSIFDKTISERLEEMESSSARKNDVLDALLSLVQSNELQLREVRHLLFDLFIGGTETTSTTLEWAMAELMHDPKKMRKAQKELEKVIGKANSLEEEDTSRLPYLQAVVKETLRLHPPAPFLIPRTVYKDTILGDYIVPNNAQVLVNVAGIQKDPSLWDNPESFQPERFLGSSFDFKGHCFQLLPFGSGRRICPGLPLASIMLHLMLGSLIHTFEWKLEDGVTPKTLNMKEKVGANVIKLKPMLVIPIRK